MKQKKIPLRKCTGCGEMKPKQDLVRVVRAPSVTDEEGVVLKEGEIFADGNTQDILLDKDLMQECDLELPLSCQKRNFNCKINF